MRFCQQCTRLHSLDRFDGDKRGCRDSLERQNQKRRSRKLHQRAAAAAAAGRTLMEGAIINRQGADSDGASNHQKCRKLRHGDHTIPSHTSVVAASLVEEATGYKNSACCPLLTSDTMTSNHNCPGGVCGGAWPPPLTPASLEEQPRINVPVQSPVHRSFGMLSKSINPSASVHGWKPPEADVCFEESFPDLDIYGKFSGFAAQEPHLTFASIQPESIPEPFSAAFTEAPPLKASRGIFDIEGSDFDNSYRDERLSESDYHGGRRHEVLIPLGTTSPTPAHHQLLCTNDPNSSFTNENLINAERVFMMDTLFEKNCLSTAEIAEEGYTSKSSLLSDVAWLNREDQALLDIRSDEASNNSSHRSHVYPVSFKLLGLAPGDLPPNMQASLISMMQARACVLLCPCASQDHVMVEVDFVFGEAHEHIQVVPDMVDGAIRPGCIELTIDFWLRNQEEYLIAKKSLREAILDCNKALPAWLQSANITVPDGTISIRDGNATLGAETFQTLHIVAVDTHLTGAGEAKVVLGGYHGIEQMEGLCRLNGRFHELTIFEVAYDTSNNTSLIVSLPIGETGIVWVEFIVRQGSERQSLKGTVPLVVTEFFELAREVSPHLRQLWRHGQKAELAGFLKDVYVLGAQDTNALEAFCSSCARLLVQATRHGWEETLLGVCDQAEAGGCLKEVLMATTLGGTPLLVHAAMCEQFFMAIHVLELLRSVNLLQEASQWRDRSLIPAMDWAARYSDSQLLQLLVMNCPNAVIAEKTRFFQDEAQAVDRAIAASSSKGESTSSDLPTTHSTQARRYDVASPRRGAPQMHGAWFVHKLSEWPVRLFSCLMLMTLMTIEAQWSGAWVTERNVLFVMAWVNIFVLFPWAHKALLQRTFDRVFHHAAQHGLHVSTSMFFTDEAVQESYGKWVIHNMGYWWWLFVEGVQLWWPLLAQSKKALSGTLPIRWTMVVILLVCLLSWCRWKAIRKGDLETMQWMSLSISLFMHTNFIQTWAAQPPTFFFFSWPYFLACMSGIRLGFCLLQLITELAPMAWLHSGRFSLSLLTISMAGLAISAAERNHPDRVFQPLLLYYISVGGLQWHAYWLLRVLLEANRMNLYIKYVQEKKK